MGPLFRVSPGGGRGKEKVGGQEEENQPCGLSEVRRRECCMQEGRWSAFRCCREVEQDGREPSLDVGRWRWLVPWTSVSGDGWLWTLDSGNLLSEWEVLQCSACNASRRFAERGAKKCGGGWRDLDPCFFS